MPEATLPQAVPVCHIVTHVHWDREWYRPFEGYRSRLLELVKRICDAVESGELASFHLDGQTVTLQDVASLRPDLGLRLRALVDAGSVTLGPWHVLADNQLVSAENLVRNLFLARRIAGGTLSRIGYSPDAFGHPADLPRLLRGFGIDSALVWRGAPPQLARFRWRSPDGSEVFTVNQAYHQAEVLWQDSEAARSLTDFLAAEKSRLPEGPWLLLNGGDHLYPVHPRDRAEALHRASDYAQVRESTLELFFEAARSADPEPPVVDGELRYLGDRLTFLLPGTLSARGYVKQLNDRAQVLLERFVEPALATRGEEKGTGSAIELLTHAWELLVLNAPHDSICGCSVDEVHRETTVRAQRVLELCDHLVRRAALRDGWDTRGAGPPATDQVQILVRSGDGGVTSAPVVVNVAVGTGCHVTGLRAPDGTEVPVEAEYLGPAEWFEADLDLLPNTSRGDLHRIAFVAHGLPAFGEAVWTAVLGPEPAKEPRRNPGIREVEIDDVRLTLEDDASITATTANGTYPRLGLMVDGGDRGDSYNFDPPSHDVLIVPRLVRAETRTSPVRSRIVFDAVLEIPRGLAAGRDARSANLIELPLQVVVERWAGDPVLRWTIDLDNTAEDHRLRWHCVVPDHDGDPPEKWRADTHWSVQERPFGPVLGPMPTEPGFEASVGTAPAHTFAVAGHGVGTIAVLLDALPEVQGVVTDGEASLAVTLLRAIGWLSRFDLRTRTTGAGPSLEVPEAQCRGVRTARLGVLIGADADDEFGLALAAARHHTGVWATQLRGGTYDANGSRPPKLTAPTVRGALVSALKPAEAGDGLILRLVNPTKHSREASVDFQGRQWRVREVRLDESPQEWSSLGAIDTEGATAIRTLAVPLGPFGVRTLRLTAGG